MPISSISRSIEVTKEKFCRAYDCLFRKCSPSLWWRKRLRQKRSVEVAQKQEAKSWELRAATSMARLWQKQGKREEAHTLLADVYNWFTEGFDTRDLKDAQALLEELA